MKKVPEYKGKIKYSSEKFTEMIQLEEKIGRTIEKLYIISIYAEGYQF